MHSAFPTGLLAENWSYLAFQRPGPTFQGARWEHQKPTKHDDSAAFVAVDGAGFPVGGKGCVAVVVVPKGGKQHWKRRDDQQAGWLAA